VLEIFFGELVGVDDQRAAFFEIGKVHLQGRRIHGHQNVRLIAGRADVVIGKVQLKAADTGQAARGRANLGRKVRQRRDVVADNCRRVSELRSRQLHAVARVAGKTDGDGVEFLKMLVDCFDRWFYDCAHDYSMMPLLVS